MELTNKPGNRVLAWLDGWLNALRRHSAGSLPSALVRNLRLLFHYGPWRVIPSRLIRLLRPPLAIPVSAPASASAREPAEPVAGLLEPLDAAAVAAELRQSSFYLAGPLPAQPLARLQAIAGHLPVDHYQLIHRIDPDVRELARDPALLSVLRAYFGSEPALLESTLTITRPGTGTAVDGQNSFHFDYAGWESLNVFVYLSDVGIESSHHMVARGSHRQVGAGAVLRAALRGPMPDAEAERRFGDSILKVLGPAGTVFIENTEAYHKRHVGNERRVMLNLLYASHRSVMSRGRVSQRHLLRRQQRYEAALAEAKRCLPGLWA